jgi:hypothetical protein
VHAEEIPWKPVSFNKRTINVVQIGEYQPCKRKRIEEGLVSRWFIISESSEGWKVEAVAVVRNKDVSVLTDTSYLGGSNSASIADRSNQITSPTIPSS